MTDAPEATWAARRREDLLKLGSRFEEGNRAEKSKVDRLGKILSSFGVIVIGGVGIVKFADVFPYESAWYVAALMAAGFLAMLASAATGAWLLYRSERPSVMRSNQASIDDLSDRERALVHSVYANALVATDAVSLRAYETRAARLERVANRVPAAGDRLREEAGLIDAERGIAFRIARNAVLSARVRRAIFAAGACTAVFLAGLGTVLVTTDWVEADRASATKAAEAAQAAAAPAPKESLADAELRVKVEQTSLEVDRACAANRAAGVYETKPVPAFCLPPAPPETPFKDWIEKNAPLFAPLLGFG